MTNEQLITELNKHPNDAKVFICGPVTNEVPEISEVEYDKEDNQIYLF